MTDSAEIARLKAEAAQAAAEAAAAKAAAAQAALDAALASTVSTVIVIAGGQSTKEAIAVAVPSLMRGPRRVRRGIRLRRRR